MTPRDLKNILVLAVVMTLGVALAGCAGATKTEPSDTAIELNRNATEIKSLAGGAIDDINRGVAKLKQ